MLLATALTMDVGKLVQILPVSHLRLLYKQAYTDKSTAVTQNCLGA